MTPRLQSVTMTAAPTRSPLDRSPQCKGINTHRGCTQAYRTHVGGPVLHCGCLCHYQEPADVDRAAAQLYAMDPGTGENESSPRDLVMAAVITEGVTAPPPALHLVHDADTDSDAVAELAIVRDERDTLAHAYALAIDELTHWRTLAGVFAGKEFDRAVQEIIDRNSKMPQDTADRILDEVLHTPDAGSAAQQMPVATGADITPGRRHLGKLHQPGPIERATMRYGMPEQRRGPAGS